MDRNAWYKNGSCVPKVLAPANLDYCMKSEKTDGKAKKSKGHE